MPKKRLDGKRFDGYWMEPESIKIVGLDVPISDELAYLYDPRAKDDIDEKMVANIMTYGVAEPVIVTSINAEAFVVDGRGRVRASREANIRLVAEGKEPLRVPVVLRRGAEHELFGVMISANEIRRDDNPMYKARKVQRFLNMGRTKTEAATAFGVSLVSVTNWTRLLDLAKPVQQLVEQGKLSANAASKLSELDLNDQVEKAFDLLSEENKKPTANRIKEAVSGKPAAPGKKFIRNIIDVELETRGMISSRIKPQHNNFISALLYILGDLSAADIGLNTKITEDEVRRIRKAERDVKKAEKKAQEAEEAAQAARAKKRADTDMSRGVIVKRRKMPAA